MGTKEPLHLAFVILLFDFDPKVFRNAGLGFTLFLVELSLVKMETHCQ